MRSRKPFPSALTDDRRSGRGHTVALNEWTFIPNTSVVHPAEIQYLVDEPVRKKALDHDSTSFEVLAWYSRRSKPSKFRGS